MVRARDEAWAHVMHEHPVVAHYQRVRRSPVLRISDFLSARQLRDMALYCEHYGPLGGVLDCLPVLWTAGDAINAIGVHRQKQFTEREQAMMNFVGPHLVQAHSNALTVSRLTRESAHLERALEASLLAVVFLRNDRTVEFATELGRKWMIDYFDQPIMSERLPEVLDLWVRQHAPTVRQALELPPPRDPLTVVRNQRRLVVKLLPAEDESVLVMEDQSLTIEAASLTSLELTAREREVLAWIANGRSKAEISSSLGINPRTVETHLRNINEQLGVTSATAAAAKAFQASRVGESSPKRMEASEIRRRVNRRRPI
jgi:DNA-binding CsgD family transcriptional regulator